MLGYAIEVIKISHVKLNTKEYLHLCLDDESFIIHTVFPQQDPPLVDS